MLELGGEGLNQPQSLRGECQPSDSTVDAGKDPYLIVHDDRTRDESRLRRGNRMPTSEAPNLPDAFLVRKHLSTHSRMLSGCRVGDIRKNPPDSVGL